MTILIEKIEAEIDRAANDKAAIMNVSEIVDNYKISCDSFKAGAQFLLPLLKKAIELHNTDIDLMFSWSDECRQMRDDELLKLIGCEHE